MYFVGISPAPIIFLSYPRQGPRVPVLSPAALSKQYLPLPDRMGRHIPANRGAAGSQMAQCQRKRRVADSNLSVCKIIKKSAKYASPSVKKAHLVQFSLKDFNISARPCRLFRTQRPRFSHATRRILPRTCHTPKKNLPHFPQKARQNFQIPRENFQIPRQNFRKPWANAMGARPPLGKHTGKPPRNVAGVPPTAEAGGTRQHIVGPNLREPYPMIRNMAGIFPKSGSPVCFHSLMLRVLIHSLSVVMPAATHNRVRGAQAWQMSAKSLALR